MPTIKLTDRIQTDFSGYNKLTGFYHEASTYRDEQIHICIEDLKWMDANLSALLDAILYKLRNENHLTFTMDFDLAERKFDVLLRNGFLKQAEEVSDVQKSTLPNMHFNIQDKNPYMDYLNKWLINHRGFPRQYSSLQDSLVDQLIEVFGNSHHHSGSHYPFFVCGQFFPSQACLILSMVDLGEGFLPRINQVDRTIQNSRQAIQWALKKGNSTKYILDGTPGGLGLTGLLEYCNESNGGMQIISGDGFWSSEYEGILANGRKIIKPFNGTMVNLFFRS